MKLLILTLLFFGATSNSFSQTKKNPGTSSKSKTKPSKIKINPNAALIIGTWDLKQSPVGDGMNMMQTWVFEKNSFSVEGYPELKQKGMYKVIKNNGDTLTLKLFKQEGHWGTQDKEQKIIFSKDKKNIRINNMDFRRKE